MTADAVQPELAAGAVVAALLAAVALAAAAAGAATSNGDKRLRTGWYALAALLGLMSIDEVGGVHESLIDVIRSAVDLPGFLFYAAWVIPALAILAAFTVWQIGFFRRLPRWLAVRIGVALGVYVLGAIGLEMLEGGVLAEEGGTFTPLMQVLVGIEEGIEMAAAAVILLALLRHLADRAPVWRLAFAPDARIGAGRAEPTADDDARFTREPAAVPADRERA